MQAKTPRASEGENKAISRRADEELFNRGNLAVADELFAPDFVYHDPAGEELSGPENVKAYAAMLRAAYPDLHQTIEDQIAEGDKVAYRWTARGTHEGELMGIAPTGKRVEFTGIAVARLANGKIEEIWENYDALGMMRQLGVVPSPECSEGLSLPGACPTNRHVPGGSRNGGAVVSLAEALATLGPEPRAVAPTNVLRKKRPIGRCADRSSRRYRQQRPPVGWRSDSS